MKRITILVLVLMLCAACFASCAQVEQEIGQFVSVAAVEAIAEELEKQDVECTLLGQEELAEMQDTCAQILAEEYGVEMQGELTAVLTGEYTNPQTDEWVLYLAFGFSTTADADAIAKFANDEYADKIAQGKAIVAKGGYVVSITVSSVVIDQGE